MTGILLRRLTGNPDQEHVRDVNQQPWIWGLRKLGKWLLACDAVGFELSSKCDGQPAAIQ